MKKPYRRQLGTGSTAVHLFRWEMTQRYLGKAVEARGKEVSLVWTLRAWAKSAAAGQWSGFRVLLDNQWSRARETSGWVCGERVTK